VIGIIIIELIKKKKCTIIEFLALMLCYKSAHEHASISVNNYISYQLSGAL
jgi:hypothetical protein